MNLIQEYKDKLNKIYEHVGFKEDWVVYPLDDCTECYWFIDVEEVRFAETKEKLLNSDGEYYVDEIYKQRFYNQWVYRGKLFTMIFCDSGVDGMKYFRLFDNKKEVNL